MSYRHFADNIKMAGLMKDFS